MVERILEACRGLSIDGWISYGTAGFRTLASRLDQVAFRAGLIALQRASQNQKYIGVMITASHNPIDDNGLKLIDFTGQMMPQELQKYIQQFVNSANFQQRLIQYTSQDLSGTVLIGRDTRPSSQGLATRVKEAVQSAGGRVHDYGLLTTPQLHFLVEASTSTQQIQPLEYYYNHYRLILEQLVSDIPIGQNYQTELVLDVSGGVGLYQMQEIQVPGLNIQIINTDHSLLNTQCGADFVHTNKKLPSQGIVNTKSASYDGDADRLIYYKESEVFSLVGGERLTILYAAALKKLQELDGKEYSVSVVTTGYTNDASVQYLQGIGVEVVIVATGVKHLHAAAQKNPLSIYFESNGHGTILVSGDFKIWLQEHSCQKSLKFIALANQFAGDALADLLMAEVAFRILDWKVDQVISLYQDHPSKLVAVKTDKKDLIKTTSNQLEVLQPEEIKQAIVSLKSQYPGSKILVRPSGTEPIVRVLVEAQSGEECEVLIERLIEVLNQLVKE